MSGATAAQPSKLRILLENIKFEHTIFALPFAYLGMVLARQSLPTLWEFIWVTLAMVGARTAAMSLNRYIDREFDARNPRTAMRPIPAGLLSPRSVLLMALAGLALLLISAAALNPLCLALSPIAVLALTLYSYTKRWTWLCHLALGFTDAIAPAGGWLAVRPEFTPAMLLLAAAVGVWIAGFDIIYACQDVDFDRRTGLYSIPARFGIPVALRLSSLLHMLMVVLLIGVGLLLGLSWLYYVGVGATAALLVYEHKLVPPDDLSRLDIAFFNVNSYIAGVLFIFTLASLLI